MSRGPDDKLFGASLWSHRYTLTTVLAHFPIAWDVYRRNMVLCAHYSTIANVPHSQETKLSAAKECFVTRSKPNLAYVANKFGVPPKLVDHNYVLVVCHGCVVN